MRSMFRTVLLALLSVLALGAVAASAAQAAEGPFYKIAGARLASGETKEVKATAYTNYTISWAGINITCTKQTSASGAKLIGSTGANFGGGTVTIEWAGCTQTGNGTSCKLAGEKITTEPLHMDLGFASTSRTGEIRVELKTANAKSQTFGELKFEGTCTFKSAKLVGEIAASVATSTTVDEVGKEPAEAAANYIYFHGINQNTWLEEGGKLVEHGFKEEVLSAFGSPVAIQGRSALELAGSAKWGVYT